MPQASQGSVPGGRHCKWHSLWPGAHAGPQIDVTPPVLLDDEALEVLDDEVLDELDDEALDEEEEPLEEVIPPVPPVPPVPPDDDEEALLDVLEARPPVPPVPLELLDEPQLQAP